MLSPLVRRFPERVYVPNSESNTVSVINPRTFKVIDRFPVGALPQHVTPSYDLKTLWVDNDQGNSLTPIDPATGKPGKPVSVTDPYNLYFTPDGHYAIVVAERLERLDFRDAQTMRLHHCPVAAAPTWEACRPTARCSGSPAVTTPRSTRSAPGTASCWPASPCRAARMGSASTPSPVGTRSGTPGSFAEERRSGFRQAGAVKIGR
ncbi:MAG: YncE family protein [Trebonia sp.]